jgi:WD40 repeat protein
VVEKKGTSASINAICFNGRRVIYGDDETAVVMDTTTKMEVDRIEIGSYIWHMTVSHCGGVLFVGCEDNTGRVADIKTKKIITLKDHTDVVRGIIECEEADVLTCSDDKTIRRWNRLTGECIRTYAGHSDRVLSILYDKKTKRIFSGSDDRTIMVCNAGTGEQIGVMNGHSDWVTSLAFVNYTTIVSSSWDNTLKMWDITTMKEIKTMSSHTDFVYSVAATPDGQYVVSGSDDNTVKVWRVATGECITTLSHHSDHVNHVAVSPDGRFIASGGYDRIMHLIRVSPPFPFIVHEGSLANSSQATSDHQLLSDGTLLRVGQSSVVARIPFSVTFIEHNSKNNHESSFSAHSEESARQWMEAFNAVQNNLVLHPDKQSFTSRNMISRYRFDLLQTISIVHKRNNNQVFIPKDIMKIIGNYLVCV